MFTYCISIYILLILWIHTYTYIAWQHFSGIWPRWSGFAHRAAGKRCFRSWDTGQVATVTISNHYLSFLYWRGTNVILCKVEPQFLAKLTCFTCRMLQVWSYAQNWTFVRSLCFLARNGPSFHGRPQSLRRVVAANCCETSQEANFVSYALRGATPSVPSIPARRLEPWMKHVLKPWKKWHIMSSWANVRFCRKYTYTARTGVLPGEVRFDCAGPVFYAFWDIGGMAEWLTGFVSKRTKP